MTPDEARNYIAYISELAVMHSLPDEMTGQLYQILSDVAAGKSVKIPRRFDTVLTSRSLDKCMRTRDSYTI